MYLVQQGLTESVLTTTPRGNSSRYFLYYWQMVIVVGQQMESIGTAHIPLLSNKSTLCIMHVTAYVSSIETCVLTAAVSYWNVV